LEEVCFWNNIEEKQLKLRKITKKVTHLLCLHFFLPKTGIKIIFLEKVAEKQLKYSIFYFFKLLKRYSLVITMSFFLPTTSKIKKKLKNHIFCHSLIFYDECHIVTYLLLLFISFFYPQEGVIFVRTNKIR
jgi:hypothetical protein